MQQHEVRASLTIQHNGSNDKIDLGTISYARLSALQVSLAAALTALTVIGVSRVADMTEGKADRSPAGTDNLRIKFDVDHGKGGSGAELWYKGFSAQDVNEVIAVARAALSA